MATNRSLIVEKGEFFVAVREQRQGPASEAAFKARPALAEELTLEAEMADEAIEILLAAVMDAGRIYGPSDERRLDTRLRLGNAYVAAGYLHDAYGIHWNLVADTVAAHGPEASITGEFRAAAQRTEMLLDAPEEGLTI